MIINLLEKRSNILIYQAEDGKTRIGVLLEGEPVWLTQATMAGLFRTTPQNITLYIKSIYAAGELGETATCKEYLQVQHKKGDVEE